MKIPVDLRGWSMPVVERKKHTFGWGIGGNSPVYHEVDPGAVPGFQ